MGERVIRYARTMEYINEAQNWNILRAEQEKGLFNVVLDEKKKIWILKTLKEDWTNG